MAAPRKKAEHAITTVSVRVNKKHPTSRWRAGMCFTAEPRVESVNDEVLAQLQADPLLIVEVVADAPATEG